MKLQRVQVPDFRVLKNVDISFEKDFVPNIFPLGSKNGGGKSTLLQLIFVLLHCSGDSDKHEFIKNMLHGFEIDDDSQKRVLAKFDIWDGEKTVNLEFVAYKDSYLKETITSYFKTDKQYDYKELIFYASTNLTNIENKITALKYNLDRYEQILNKLENLKLIENREQKYFRLKQLIEEVFEKNDDFEEPSIEEFQEEIKEFLDIDSSKFIKYSKEYEQIQRVSQVLSDCLGSVGILYISNYSAFLNTKPEGHILCHINNIDISDAKEFLNQLSNKIFLAAPSTQIFLFLARDSRNLLFKQQNNGNINNYSSQLKSSQSKLPGFFTYDFLAVDLLIDIFKSARDKDFKQAIETGEYGNNYQKLVNDLNQILLNKKININLDLSGFTFKLDAEGHDIELYPEDLSHGELKRLSIYAWIKYNIIEDSIVLIDEIENGFHPDWQYQIIRDIAEWAPKNQYIIGTHSYELCQAVTPAHVKELEPRLIKQESES